MRKIAYFLVVVQMLLILSACKEGGSTMLWGDKDNNLADERIEQIFTALQNQDNTQMKSTFSSEAIQKAGNFDDKLAQLMAFIQGEPISWEREESPFVLDSVENGKKAKKSVIWFSLFTDQAKYSVFLVDYPIDTINPENEGLYTLMILHADDEDQLSGTWEDWVTPGICVMDSTEC